jgi:hypothetical protein
MDKFNMINPEVQDWIIEISAKYVIQNGKVKGDGSVGKVKMTPDELHEIMAKCFRKGHSLGHI